MQMRTTVTQPAWSVLHGQRLAKEFFAVANGFKKFGGFSVAAKILAARKSIFKLTVVERMNVWKHFIPGMN